MITPYIQDKKEPVVNQKSHRSYKKRVFNENGDSYNAFIMNAGTKHIRDFEEEDQRLQEILKDQNEPLKRRIISENLKDMIKRSEEDTTQYAEYLRGYGLDRQIERIQKTIEDNNETEITTMKDVYIIGLEKMEVNKKKVARDALKGIRVQYNNSSQVNKNNGAEKYRLEQLRSMVESFPNWQERDLKNDYILKREDLAKQQKNKSTERVRDHNLIQPQEWQPRPNKYWSRIEDYCDRVEGIDWAKSKTLDYYFLAESGEFKDRYIKLEGEVKFGRDVSDQQEEDERAKEGWLLFQEDKKVSRHHFEIEVDYNNFCINVKDMGSKLGTWLALMHHVDEQIIPEIQYKSSYLDSFKFELGMRCDTLEEVLDAYARLDMVDTLIALDLDTITKITRADPNEVVLILDSLEVLENGQQDIINIIKRIKNDFSGDYINRRLIFKTVGDTPELIDIESGFRGNHLGLVDINGKPSISNCAFNDHAFDRKLLHISYKHGVYYMKSSGFTNIYRKFIPEEKFSIYPGHRVCFGANVFYLLQYINFSLGEQNTVLVKEYTSISELTNVSLYAIIESVGIDPCCKDYIFENLHDKLSSCAKELGLDQSTTFYKTLTTVIYKAYDELDIGFMNRYPKKRKLSGAKVLLYLIVANKLFCVNLGDMQGHLIMASKLKKTNTKHSMVNPFINLTSLGQQI